MIERLRDERGLTIAEGTVACLLLAIGSLATLQLFDVGMRTTYRAEQDQSLSNRLQSELEEMTSLGYPAIAMTAVPSDTSDPEDPRSRVNGTEYAVEEGGGSQEPLVVDATNGQVSSSPESFTVGDISGQIYKFVVWRDDPTCSESLCPGGEDLKRVIVAARVNDSGIIGSRGYQEVHSDIVDPDAAPVDNPGPGNDPNNPNGYAHEFFITDTPCSESERQPITGDHATHNTRGACSAGLLSGLTPGAPDLMFTEAVELDEDFPPDEQPQFDYATDLEPTTNPELDKGLFVREPQLTNGCILASVANLLDLSVAESNRQQKVHKWVTAPMPTDFELLLTGNATLQLWTKTVNGVTQGGRICVYLFIRRTVDGQPVDIPLLTAPGVTFTSYTDTTWPTDWEEISVDVPFLSLPTLLPNERLGVAIQVERANTGNDGLEFMYDHPSFESRLQIQADQVLPF